MKDLICRYIAAALPKRAVSYCVLRVLWSDEWEGRHPSQVGWFEALERFDPKMTQRPKLRIVAGQEEKP